MVIQSEEDVKWKGSNDEVLLYIKSVFTCCKQGWLFVGLVELHFKRPVCILPSKYMKNSRRIAYTNYCITTLPCYLHKTAPLHF